MKPRRTLLVAYQCGPGMGSVSQIGWEWYSRLSRRDQVTLVTHVRNRPALEKAGAPVNGSEVIYIDTEWFAGPLYRVARRLFPRSEHSIFLITSLDFFVFDRAAYRQLRDRMRQAGAPLWDVVHRVTPVTLAAPTWLGHLGIPLVVGPLNSGLQDPPGFKTFMRQEYTWLIQLREFGRWFDGLIGSTRRAARLLVATKATRAGVPRRYQDRCRFMLENGVELERFAATPWPAAPSATEPLRVLFVGRLIPVKALSLLVDAVHRVQQTGQAVHLTVVGDGPMRPDWEAQVDHLSMNDTVTFTGALPMDRVADQMRRCHVFCLPSLRESGGAVLLEAMASARPVVAVAFGGPAELVDDTVGAAIVPVNPEQVTQAFADALLDVVQRPAVWAQRGLNGRSTVEQHHSWDAKVASSAALYDELVKEPCMTMDGTLNSLWQDEGKRLPAAAHPVVAHDAYRRMAYLISRYPAVSHTFILREVRQLRAMGFDISTASVNPPDRSEAEMTADEREEAQRTYGLKQHGVVGALAGHLWGLRHPKAYWRGLKAGLQFGGWNLKNALFGLFYFTESLMLARWMEQQGMRHLHVHFATAAANIALILKQMVPITLSLTIHGPDEFYDVPGQKLMEKIAAADFLVCIGRFARSQLMKLSPASLWRKFDICPLGVDVANYNPDTAAQAASTAPAEARPFTILCVGRLTPAKGQHILIDACAQLRDWGHEFRLVVVGTGPDEASLRALAQAHRLENHVHFTGAQNQDQVRDWYRQSDVFALPSFAEGIPVVLMEAMASGVPCLTTRITGIPELIRDGIDGLLVTPSDVQELADGLATLMADPELRRELGDAGRRRVNEAYNLPNNVARLADIFSTRLKGLSC